MDYTQSGNREKATSILKMAGIHNPPVNVYKIAKLLGFSIIESDFPINYSGEIFIENNVKSIGINKNHSLTRQRFTIAHELGHYLNGHQYFDEEGKMLEDSEFDFSNPIRQQEKEANLFASELLIPKEFLIKELEQHGLDINKLTEHFEVSSQAMWIRLTSLKLVEKYSPATR